MVFKNMIIYLLVCLAFVTTGRANDISANQTLDSLIAVALERNPAIHAAEYSRSAAEFKAKSTGLLPDPTLSAAVLNLPRTSLSFDETPMSGVVLGLSQAVPWPGKLSAKSDIAHLGALVKETDLAARRAAVTREVTHFYYEYSHWTRVESVLTEKMQLVESIIRVAQTRFANGDGSLQNVLRSETSKARIENRILMARQKASSALVQLARLTDNPATVDAELVPILPPIPHQDMTAGSELSNPWQARASFGSAAAKRKVDLAKSGYWPNLMFGIDYRIRKNIPMDAVSGEDFLTFKVGFNLPIWFFGRQRNQTAAAEHSYSAAQANEHAVRNSIDRRVADISLALRSLRERTAQYETTILPQAEATGKAAQVAYEVGRVDFNGLLSSQLDVMNIELERLELIKQYHQKTAALVELATDFQEIMK